MEDKKYKLSYANSSVYGKVVKLIEKLDLNDDGVHLDIAWGNRYSTINECLKKHNYNFEYIGIDQNRDAVNYLKENGLEGYEYDFTGGQQDIEFINNILGERSLRVVTMLDFIEHVPNPEAFLYAVYEVCKKHSAVLLISVPNVCHKDIAFKMMQGKFDYTDSGLLDITHLSLFSEERLTKCMNDTGFQELLRNDYTMELSDQHFPVDSTFLQTETTLYKYLDYVKTLVDPFATVNQFVRAYAPVTENEEPFAKKDSATQPFLSIITRTQGKRIEELSEVLLCLTAQTNTDFEVLVVGHKLTVERQIAVEGVIEELPDWIREKVRLIKVNHGNRTTPLNIGFEKANGKYISILDDDDIVFDNWVEEFYNLFKKFPGTVLHVYSLKQDWNVINCNCDRALRATGSPDNVYCCDFDILKQINSNYCPTTSYAFPSYTFKKLGVKFDEELCTTEDWDFLMRTAFLTGVSNLDKVTSICRIWVNAENSHSCHSKEVWLDCENRMKDKFSKIPVVLSPAYIQESSISCYDDEEIFTSLYIDYGRGLTEANVRLSKYDKENKNCIFSDILDEEQASYLRFDPGEKGMIWVSNIDIEITTRTNQVLEYKLEDISNNGIQLDDGILFLKSDPQINIPLKNPIKIKDVKVTCDISSDVPDHIIAKINNSDFTSLYIDYGRGLTEANVRLSKYDKKNRNCIFSDISDEEQASYLRFDPGEKGMIWVSNIDIEITTRTNQVLEYKLEDISNNGIQLDDGILFLKSDPQINIPLKNPIKIKDVKVTCDISSDLSHLILNNFKLRKGTKVINNKNKIFTT